MTTNVETQGKAPEESLRGFWLLYLAWGGLSVIFGILLLTRPSTTALIWVQIMAIFFLVGGVVDLVGAVVERGRAWVWRLIGGILGVLVGLYILSEPIWGTLATIQVLFLLLAIDAMLNGFVNLWAGFSKPRSILQIVLGVFQIFIGGWLLMHPLVGMVALIPVFGIALIVFGLLAIFLAFRFRTM